MAKRKRQQDSEARIREGKGNGIGKDYKPCIKLQLAEQQG
jgi:hypothetical protein